MELAGQGNQKPLEEDVLPLACSRDLLLLCFWPWWGTLATGLAGWSGQAHRGVVWPHRDVRAQSARPQQRSQGAVYQVLADGPSVHWRRRRRVQGPWPGDQLEQPEREKVRPVPRPMCSQHEPLGSSGTSSQSWRRLWDLWWQP